MALYSYEECGHTYWVQPKPAGYVERHPAYAYWDSVPHVFRGPSHQHDIEIQFTGATPGGVLFSLNKEVLKRGSGFFRDLLTGQGSYKNVVSMRELPTKSSLDFKFVVHWLYTGELLPTGHANERWTFARLVSVFEVAVDFDIPGLRDEAIRRCAASLVHRQAGDVVKTAAGRVLTGSFVSALGDLLELYDAKESLKHPLEPVIFVLCNQFYSPILALLCQRKKDTQEADWELPRSDLYWYERLRRIILEQPRLKMSFEDSAAGL